MCDHTIDPAGDVVLVLESPNEQFAHKLPAATYPAGHPAANPGAPSALGPAYSPDPGQNEPGQESLPAVTFVVSSRHLAEASPVFKAQLANSPAQITAKGWHVDALLPFLRAVHGQAVEAPRSLATMKRLAKSAVLIDYYAAHPVVPLLYPPWIEPATGMIPCFKGVYPGPRELRLSAIVTSIDGYGPNFLAHVRATATAALADANWVEGQPLPESAIRTMQRLVEQHLDEIRRRHARLSTEGKDENAQAVERFCVVLEYIAEMG